MFAECAPAVLPRFLRPPSFWRNLLAGLPAVVHLLAGLSAGLPAEVKRRRE
jgi:hypothetical protein